MLKTIKIIIINITIQIIEKNIRAHIINNIQYIKLDLLSTQIYYLFEYIISLNIWIYTRGLNILEKLEYINSKMYTKYICKFIYTL